jgi:membrane-associated protease RseP (regulator of RpoE activity)
LFVLIALVANPLAEAMIAPNGVRITEIEQGSPAASAGMQEGGIITGVDGSQFAFLENLSTVLSAKKPGDTITLQTSTGTYRIVLAPNAKNSSKAYLGILSRQHAEVKEGFKSKYGGWCVPIILWLFGMVYWLFLLSIGIGLFNLLPIGPIDGGRMLHIVMQKLFKQPGSQRAWKFVSMMFFLLVMINVIAGFLK